MVMLSLFQNNVLAILVNVGSCTFAINALVMDKGGLDFILGMIPRRGHP